MTMGIWEGYPPAASNGTISAIAKFVREGVATPKLSHSEVVSHVAVR